MVTKVLSSTLVDAITETSGNFTGNVTAGSFSGPLTGDVTGNVTGNTSGSAAILSTPRAIYGNNFDGSAALNQIIASTYGGTGNGFTKFAGPITAEKTFTLPNSNATLLYSGGSLGTPINGTLTNCTELPVSTGISGLGIGMATFLTTTLGTGVSTFLSTPSSANLLATITDETGTGSLVFSVSPALTGTPTAPTATPGTNTTQIATTAYVVAVGSLKANLAAAAFSGAVSATGFTGPLVGAVTGNVTGNCTGSSGSCTGNAASATTAASCSGNAATATSVSNVPIPAAWDSIGSWIMAICRASGPFTAGQTASFSQIEACSAAGAGTGTFPSAGTWRCTGYASTSQIGLFIRIS